MSASLIVKISSDKTFTVKIDLTCTVAEMKVAVQKESDIDAADQRLIYAGQVLRDDRTLESYGIKDTHTMHLVARKKPTQASAQPAQPAQSQPSAQPEGQANPQPQANLFANMFQNQGAGGQFQSQGGFGQALGGFGQAQGGFGQAQGGFGAIDPNMVAGLMSDPMVQNTMQQVLQNPEMLQNILQSNPMAQNMLQSNPGIATMLQNPDFIRQMSNPATIQAMLQMSQMGGMGGMGQMGQMGGMGGMGGFQQQQQGGQPPMDFAQMFASMGGGAMGGAMGGAGTGASTGASAGAGVAQPQQNQEERFAVQLQQLSDMGFTNKQVNIQALAATSGNVEAAIERILMG